MHKLAFSSIFALIFLSGMALYAHPPADIQVKYDGVTNMLSMVIIHPTKNIQEHHINQVTIEVNGKNMLDHRITMQMNPSGQDTAYLLTDLSPGAELSITAKCNVFGKKKITFVVPEEE